MSPSLWQIAIIVVVIVLLFGGRGRISGILSDLGKGIKSFKKGMNEDDNNAAEKKIEAEDKPKEK